MLQDMRHRTCATVEQLVVSSEVPAPTCEVAVEGTEEGIEYEANRMGRRVAVAAVGDNGDVPQWLAGDVTFPLPVVGG